MSDPFGFLIIDKPKGLTSHDCVNKIRKIFGIKRVGHGGTLDPNVTGVLPVALGQATRLLPYLPTDKNYTGIFQLGKRTVSDDLQGEIISTQPWPELNLASLEKHLDKFRGRINQHPPQISSVHIKGERAYKRARKGELFDLPQRSISIHELRLLDWNQEIGQVEISVHCSSGTYIRALARDLGNDLGCGGCLAKLRRTQALGFNEKQALQLPKSNTEKLILKDNVLPPLQALHHLPHIQLTTEKDLVHWRTGRQLFTAINKVEYDDQSKSFDHQQENQSIVITDSSSQVIGIGGWDPPSELQPKVVFNAIG